MPSGGSAPAARERVEAPSPASAPARPLALRMLPLALLAAATVLVFATGLHRYLSLDALLTYRGKLQAFVAEGQARALASLAGVYIAVVALSIPGSVFLTILAGFLFGTLVGGLLAVVSATIGAILVFVLARTSVGDLLVRRARGRLKTLTDGFRREAFSFLLFLRFLPVVPFWLVNLGAAVSGIPLRTFAAATALGIVPLTFTFATAGAGLDGVIAAHQREQRACLAAGPGAQCERALDLADLVTPRIVIALAVVGVLSLVPVLLRRRGLLPGQRLDERPGGA